MFFKRIICISLVILLSLSINVFSTDLTKYVWNSSSTPLEQSVQTNTIINSEGNNSSLLNIKCESAILIEAKTGQILYEKNSHKQLRPASVTKLMTLLLIMEAIDSGTISYADKVPCTETAAAMGGSQIWLDVREELTVDEMLKAICVVSANDCTVAMAEFLYGSQESFVEKMNLKAKELGMNDTCFKNCHGLDEDGHLTSSYDISLMSKELLNKHPDIKKYTTIWIDSLRDGKSELVNTNKLIKNYKGATGLKTGSTSQALFNLSASATRDNLSLIAVVMKGSTSAIRFEDAQKLLDYGFSNYTYKEIAKSGDVVKNIRIEKGSKNSLNLIFENSIGIVSNKKEGSNIEQILSIPDVISAPILQGDKVGELSCLVDGKKVETVNIIAQESVLKDTIGSLLKKIYKNWFYICRT